MSEVFDYANLGLDRPAAWMSRLNVNNIKRHMSELLKLTARQQADISSFINLTGVGNISDNSDVNISDRETVMREFHKTKLKYEQLQADLEAGCQQIISNKRDLNKVLATINAGLSFEDGCDEVDVTALVNKYHLTAASWFLHLMRVGKPFRMGEAVYKAADTPRDIDAAAAILRNYYYGIGYYNGLPIKQDFSGFITSSSDDEDEAEPENSSPATATTQAQDAISKTRVDESVENDLVKDEDDEQDNDKGYNERHDRALLSVLDYDDRNHPSLMYQFGVYFSKLYTAM